MTINLASFEDDGPVRIEILYPAPAEIDGMSLIFYFGPKGKRRTFELDSPVPEDLLGPAPAATVPRLDEGQGGGGGSSDGSSSCEGDDDDDVIPPAPSAGRRSPVSTVGGSSGPAGTASQVASGGGFVAVAVPPPVATQVADPEVVEEDVVSVGMEVRPSSSPRSPGGVCYSRSPGSPPSPALGPSDVEPSPLLDLAVVTPTATGSKLWGGASSLVAAR